MTLISDSLTDHPLPVDIIEAENRYNHLKVYDNFAKQMLYETPVRSREGLAVPVAYDNIDFFGMVAYDTKGNSTPDETDLLMVVRESSEVVDHNQARVMKLPYERRTEVDPKGYFIATTDGISVTEWTVENARWKISPAYWRSRKPPEDELILELVTPDQQDYKGEPQRAHMWLSRHGGTFRINNAKKSGWLIGEGVYADGPKFLDDPVA